MRNQTARPGIPTSVRQVTSLLISRLAEVDSDLTVYFEPEKELRHNAKLGELMPVFPTGILRCDQCGVEANLRDELNISDFRQFEQAYATNDTEKLSEFLLNANTPMSYPANLLHVQLAGGCDPELVLCFDCSKSQFQQEYVTIIDDKDYDLLAKQYAAGKLDDPKLKASVRNGINKYLSENSPLGHFYMAFVLWLGREEPADERGAFAHFFEAAKSGHAEAMYFVANAYAGGFGVEMNAEQSLLWHEKAYKAGHIESAFIIACLFDEGRLVPENKPLANQWYKRAADRGHAQAQHSLGVNYDQGFGCATDKEMAFHYYKMAAAQNVKASVYNLAICYRDGEGTQRDMDKFMQWIRVFETLPDN